MGKQMHEEMSVAHVPVFYAIPCHVYMIRVYCLQHAFLPEGDILAIFILMNLQNHLNGFLVLTWCVRWNFSQQDVG